MEFISPASLTFFFFFLTSITVVVAPYLSDPSVFTPNPSPQVFFFIKQVAVEEVNIV